MMKVLAASHKICLIGIPARPDPPVIDTSSDPANVSVTTPHSGVRDRDEDEFHFVIEVPVYTQYGVVLL